jgi:predicted RNase H-like HicB family nuclease
MSAIIHRPIRHLARLSDTLSPARSGGEGRGEGARGTRALLVLARVADTKHLSTMTRTLTAVLIREDQGFVALCPELDVASQGESVEEAKANLREAVELFFECASAEEVRDRLASESYVSTLEVSIA